MRRRSTWRVVSAIAGAALGISTDSRAEGDAPPERSRKHAVEADHAAPAPASPTTYHGMPFTIDAATGWQMADLATFRSSVDANALTANIIPSSLSGPSAELGFGVRWYSLTVGLRSGVAWLGSNSSQSSLELYSVDAELGLKVPFDSVEISLLFAGGYSVMGGLSDVLHGLGEGLDIDGANARFALALDYYFSNRFSVGARAEAELLFLARRGVALRDMPNQLASFDAAERGLLAGSGSSVGTAVTVCVGPAFHF